LFVSIGGACVGFQSGVESTDLVIGTSATFDADHPSRPALQASI